MTDSNSRQVLTVGIAALQSSFNDQWNLVLAASLVSLIPLLVIFAVFQNNIRAVPAAHRGQPLSTAW